MSILKFKPTSKQATQPGMGGTIYLAPIDVFDAIATAPSTGTVAGATTTIVDDHTFITIATKMQGFVKIPLIATKSGKYGFKTEGDFPAEKTVSEFEAMAVGLDATQTEWIKALKGKPMIALIEDAECQAGRIVQIGCKCKPVASVKFEWSSDNNELKMTGSAECMLNDYQGVITEMTY